MVRRVLLAALLAFGLAHAQEEFQGEAVSSSVQGDWLWKKAQNIRYTNLTKTYYEEDRTQPGGFLIYLKDIPSPSIPIPSTPAANQDIQLNTALVMTEDTSVSGHRAWTTGTSDWIEPKFGTGYAVSITDNAGTPIPLGSAHNWFFDYHSGVVAFEFDPTIARPVPCGGGGQPPCEGPYTLPLKITGYSYKGKYANAVLYQAQQSVDPGTPAANVWGLYFKSGGAFIVSSAGTVSGLVQFAGDLGGTQAAPQVVDVHCTGACIGDAELVQNYSGVGDCGAGNFARTLNDNAAPTCAADDDTPVNNAVTNAILRDSGALSVIGRSANSSGDPADISASAASDAVLRESGSVLGFGTVATGGIANDAVTYAKMQNVSLTDKVLGRSTAAAGDVEEITFSDAAQDHAQETFADDQVWVADSATAGTPRTVTNCTDTAGQHLNYTAATNLFSCGTTGDGGGLSGGVANTVTKWTAATTVGLSQITDDGTTVTWAGRTAWTPTTPTQLTVTTHNYNPGDATVIFLSSSGAISLTGIINGTQGRKLEIVNTGNYTISLPDLSASSTQGNRFFTTTGTTLGLLGRRSVRLIYDTALDTSGAWRVADTSVQAVAGTITAGSIVVVDANGESTGVAPTVSSGGAGQLLNPAGDQTADLGDATHRWNSLWTGQIINAADPIEFSTDDAGSVGRLRMSIGGAADAVPVLLNRITDLTLGGGEVGGNPAVELRLKEPAGDGDNFTAFKAGAQAADITYTLPAAVAASNGQLLASTTAGVLSWAPSGEVPHTKYAANISADTTWSISANSHGLGPPPFSITCYDSSPSRAIIIPSSVVVSPSTFDVTIAWPSTTAGRVVIYRVKTHPREYSTFFNGDASWNVAGQTHLVLSPPLAVLTYNVSGSLITPSSVSVNAGNLNVGLVWPATQDGSVLIYGMESRPDVANYTTVKAAATSFTVSGSTHALGTADLAVVVYDANASYPKPIVPSSVSVDPSTFNVSITLPSTTAVRVVLSGV